MPAGRRRDRKLLRRIQGGDPGHDPRPGRHRRLDGGHRYHRRSAPVNDYGAFVPGPRARLAPRGSGPLDGLSFVAKDLVDVAGWVTGAGNPHWASRQEPAATSAAAVDRLLDAGATLVGKTITDELA